jgi:hypothetical protein
LIRRQEKSLVRRRSRTTAADVFVVQQNTAANSTSKDVLIDERMLKYRAK